MAWVPANFFLWHFLYGEALSLPVALRILQGGLISDTKGKATLIVKMQEENIGTRKKTR